jgi:transposase
VLTEDGALRIEVPRDRDAFEPILIPKHERRFTGFDDKVVAMYARGIGLSLRIQATLRRSPCDGTAYAFANRRRIRVKLLVWDGSGVWLCQRRLHRGHFTWPSTDSAVCTLTVEQWRWLVAGVDWQRLAAAPPAHWRI